MASLWTNKDKTVWQNALDTYDSTIEKLGNDKLTELDRWYHSDFCSMFQNITALKASEAELHKALIKLVDWKLTRGKWRPRLLDFAKNADPKLVKEAFVKAFTIVSKHKDKCSQADIKTSLAALTELKGVGPATATGILAAMNPSIAFMSDEALIAVVKDRKYTVAEALELSAAMQKRAAELSDSKRTWSVQEVEKCLYATGKLAAQQEKKQKAAAAKTTTATKRKR